MKRITIAALGLVVGATAGCRDMGLEGNIQLEEARGRQTSALMRAISTPTESGTTRLVVDGRLWVAAGLPVSLRSDELRSIGSADGQTVYARAWDRSPYDALFVQLPDTAGVPAVSMPGGERWIRLDPVRGRTGPVAGAAEAGEPAGR